MDYPKTTTEISAVVKSKQKPVDHGVSLDAYFTTADHVGFQVHFPAPLLPYAPPTQPPISRFHVASSRMQIHHSTASPPGPDTRPLFSST